MHLLVGLDALRDAAQVQALGQTRDTGGECVG